jgi:membrane protein DedA with SNARE-associated domain
VEKNLEIEVYIQAMLDWVKSLDPVILWFFFVFSNFAENVFPPWPGDTVTVFGGFLVATGSGVSWFLLLSSTFLGNLIGGLFMYQFGSIFLSFLKRKQFPLTKELLEEDSLRKTFLWFEKNSTIVILLSRFSAGIRFFVSIVAGMTRTNIYLFTFLFSIAITLWCSLLIFGGYFAGKNWEHIVEILSIYNKVVSIIIVLFIGVVLYSKFFSKKA